MEYAYEKYLYKPQITSDHQLYARTSIHDFRMGEQARIPGKFPHSVIWYIVAPVNNIHSHCDAYRA